MKKMKKFYGYHLTMDLYDCKPETVGDLRECYLYLNNLPNILKAEKLSPPFIIYTDEKKYPDKAGLSGWIPITDSRRKIYSGISIHTLTPTNFISIDVYAPNKFNLKKIKKFTSKVFKPKEIEAQYFLRGG
jgi:S-adenosylmethionine/arginine decarboxylase-like enzyme